MTTLLTRHLDGLSGLRSLEAEWRRLAQGSIDYTHDYEWFESLVRNCYSDDPGVTFVVVSKPEGDTVAILPIRAVSLRLRGLRLPAWSVVAATVEGPEWMAAHADWLLDSSLDAGTVLAAALQHLRQHLAWRPVFLAGRLLVSSSLAEGATALARSGLGTALTGAGYAELDTSGSYATATAQLNQKFRRQLRAYQRQMSAAGAVSWTSYRSGEPGFDAAFAAFLAVEASGWKGEAGAGTALAVSGDSRERLWLEELGATAWRGKLEVHLLMLNDIAVGGAVCARTADTMLFLKLAHDERYRRWSPGQLVTDRLVQEGCDDPALKRLNFVTAPAWVAPWRPSIVEHLHVLLGTSRAAGLALRALLALPRRRPT